MPEIKNVADILARMKEKKPADHTVPCRVCDARVMVASSEKQWSVRCPACGNEILLTDKYRLARKFIEPKKDEAPCPYCRDTGIVSVTKQVDEMAHVFGYRCVCRAGREHSATGIPLATGVDMAAVVRQNRR